jgi:hypothetical protein
MGSAHPETETLFIPGILEIVINTPPYHLRRSSRLSLTAADRRSFVGWPRRVSVLSGWTPPLCNLCVLCVSVVNNRNNHSPQRHKGHRGYTEKVKLKQCKSFLPRCGGTALDSRVFGDLYFAGQALVISCRPRLIFYSRCHLIHIQVHGH